MRPLAHAARNDARPHRRRGGARGRRGARLPRRHGAPAALPRVQREDRRHLRREVRRRPRAVLGFEAFNEPVVFHQDQLDAFHAHFADALHAIDKDAPVLFEPISTRNQFDKAYVPSAPFSHGPGVYAPHVYTGWFSSAPGWQSDPSVLAPSMENAVAEANAWGTPLFVTEFGCDQSTSEGVAWLRDELDLQDRMLASSTAWAWGPGDRGIRHWDGASGVAYYPGTVAVVSRPYPRAVAGDLLGIERPSPDRMIVRFRTNPAVTSTTHEVSASPDYFSDFAILCDGSPVQGVTRALGRTTFGCGAGAAGEHTFEIRGALVTPP